MWVLQSALTPCTHLHTHTGWFYASIYVQRGRHAKGLHSLRVSSAGAVECAHSLLHTHTHTHTHAHTHTMIRS